jgi:hypothetical protein
MISVLVPAAGASADGLVFADPPDITEFDLPNYREVTEDCPVWVVPPGALQAFLEKSSKFKALEKKFGRLSHREQIRLKSLFELLELVRSADPQKHERYCALLLLNRQVEQAEAKVQRSQEENEQMTRTLFEHDRRAFDERGPVGELIERLGLCGSLRIWLDTRTKTVAPGIFAGSFYGALLSLLVLNLANPKSVAICPKCKSQFRRSKSTMIFCSSRCASNDRKARQRSRERQLKEETHGPRKTG